MYLCENCQTSLSNPRNRFCSHSCAAKINNRGVRRHGREPNVCIQCNQSTRNAKFCSNKCQADHEWSNEILPAIARGEKSQRNLLRKYLIDRDGYCCARCHLSEWLGEPIPLCVDHTNGDPSNNLPDNLRLLCQNCHGLTPTFAGRNRGNGRQSRGIRRYDKYDVNGAPNPARTDDD